MTQEDMQTAFSEAGLVEIDFEIIHTVRKDAREVDIFLIQGTRALTAVENTNST